MTDITQRLKLAYGRQTFPDDVHAVFGARLIWPNDLLWDRQDLAHRSDDDRRNLVAWLNGSPEGTGAIKQMKDVLGLGPERVGLNYSGAEEAVIYEDDQGIIIGSAQQSHGYIYICGYLK